MSSRGRRELRCCFSSGCRLIRSVCRFSPVRALSFLSFYPPLTLLTTELETLHLHELELRFRSSEGRCNVDLAEKGSSWHFPRLTTLSLSLVQYSSSDGKYLPTLGRFLNPISLPALSSFAFTWSSHTNDPGFGKLAAQLTHLWLKRVVFVDRAGKEHVEELPEKGLKRVSCRLEHLAVDLHKTSDFDALALLGDAHLQPLSSLSSSDPSEHNLALVFPRSLRLESPYHTNAERLLLSKSLPFMEHLDTLFLDDLSGLKTPQRTKEAPARAVVKEECEARGVKIDEKKFSGASSRECVEWDEERWRGWCDEVDREMQVQISKIEPEEQQENTVLEGYEVYK
jgi:hypothetical protein